MRSSWLRREGGNDDDDVLVLGALVALLGGNLVEDTEIGTSAGSTPSSMVRLLPGRTSLRQKVTKNETDCKIMEPIT